MSVCLLGDAQDWLSPAPSSIVTPCSHLELVMTNPAASHTLPSVEPKVELLKEQKSEAQEGEEHKTAPGAGLVPVQDSFPDECFSPEEEHRSSAERSQHVLITSSLSEGCVGWDALTHHKTLLRKHVSLSK